MSIVLFLINKHGYYFASEAKQSQTYTRLPTIAKPVLVGDQYQNNGFTDNGSFESKEYEYDHNGNMTNDRNKKITQVEYNFQNLPKSITLVNDGNFNQIFYQYDAVGNKLCKQIRTNGALVKTTNYFSTFETENGVLNFIYTPEGRAVPMKKNSYEYQYFLKDHLGNTCVVLSQTGRILQQNSYYPFGMLMSGLSDATNTTNKYLYNGKELQDEFGLDWYDYGKRFYDAQLGRFVNIDSLADKFPYKSPYDYAENKPINCVDLDGLEGLDMVRYNSMAALIDPKGFSKQTDKRNEAVNTIKILGGEAWSKGIEAGKNSPLNNISKNGYINGSLNMASGIYVFSASVGTLAAAPESGGMSVIVGVGGIAYSSSQFIYGVTQIINEASGHKKDLPQGPASLLGADIDKAAKTDRTFEKTGEVIENVINLKTIFSPSSTKIEQTVNGVSIMLNITNESLNEDDKK